MALCERVICATVQTKKKQQHTQTEYHENRNGGNHVDFFLFSHQIRMHESGNDEQRCKISVENIAVAKNIVQKIMPMNAKYLEGDSKKTETSKRSRTEQSNGGIKIGRKLSKLNLAYDTYFILS